MARWSEHGAADHGPCVHSSVRNSNLIGAEMQPQTVKILYFVHTLVPPRGANHLCNFMKFSVSCRKGGYILFGRYWWINLPNTSIYPQRGVFLQTFNSIGETSDRIRKLGSRNETDLLYHRDKFVGDRLPHIAEAMWCFCLSSAMHGQNINLPVFFCQLAPTGQTL